MPTLFKRYIYYLQNKSKFLLNKFFGKYKYTYGRDWFYKSEIYKNAQYFLGKKNKNNFRILEIGCFEGLSTTFFIDTFLSKSNSKLTAVDPFILYSDNDHFSLLDRIQIKNFFFNLSQSKYPDKVQYLGLTSDNFFEMNKTKYNFIYIDGMHTKEQIPRDIINSWNSLLVGGIIWMDDYLGDNSKLKNSFDETISSLKGKHEVIHRGYQIAIKKLS